MKATGIVRRIDELGRIVIPKEIRRTFKIREGTPLEIFCGDNDELVLKKYSMINELKDFADEICFAAFNTLTIPVFVCDKEKIIATSKNIKTQYFQKEISQKLFRYIENRKDVIKNSVESDVMIDLLVMDENKYFSQIVVPIVSGGDTYGAIVLFRKDNITLGEMELKALKVMANFLAEQIG